jgi:hypothetical protein
MNKFTPAEEALMDKEYEVVESPEKQAETNVQAGPTIINHGKLSPSEIAKLCKQYVTKQHPRVTICGHRLDMTRQPRHRNCESCYFAWFNAHGEICQQLDEMFQNGAIETIVELQGYKFLHRWLQFMATIAQYKQEIDKCTTSKT